MRETIRALNEAISHEDPGAYMLRIDPSESTFLTEQRAWITDALNNKTEKLSYTFFGGLDVVEHTPNEIWAAIGIRWLPADTAHVWNSMYMARFVPLGTPEGMWTLAGRVWMHDLRDDATGIRVLAGEHQEQLANLVLARAPEIQTRIEQDFGKKLTNPIVIKIYDDMQDLKTSISPAYADPLSGWNEPGESIKILGRDDLDQQDLDPLLAHEIGHAVSFEYGPDIITAPWWTLEGVAEVAAGLFRDSSAGKNSRLTRLASSGKLRDWSLLADFRGEANNHAMFVYLQGWSMIDCIDRSFGVGARNAWFTALAHGSSLDQASRSALKIGFDALDARWRAALLEPASADEHHDEADPAADPESDDKAQEESPAAP